MNTKESKRHTRYALKTTTFNRARDFYLYTKNGTRFIDLDMAEARAVLGYKMKNIGSRIKQNLDKGILHNIPTIWQHRFVKIISLLFPKHKYMGMYTRMYHTDKEVTPSKIQCTMWKPFAGSYSDSVLRASKPICVALPLAWDPPLYMLLLPSDLEFCTSSTLLLEDELAGINIMLQLSTVSPVLYAAFCASLALLRKCVHEQDKTTCDDMPSYHNRKFPAEHKNKANIFAITHSRDELHNIRARSTVLALPQGWTQRGIYIAITTKSDEKYQLIQETLWKWGFYMPEKPRYLITLPYFFTKRELYNWNAAIEELSILDFS